MKEFIICRQEIASDFVIEKEAWEGVKRIGARVAQDIMSVTNHQPSIMEQISKCMTTSIVLCATIGKSELLNQLQEKGKVSLNELVGKRECYSLKVIENPFEEYPNIHKVLLIAGSDKRGTIYGMFRISELCGVTAMRFWGDIEPVKQHDITLQMEDEVSKEPSVEYRGFFINDEWPAFGNWCMEKFGGVNANAYEAIFELLLRLRGNYLWPAMWDSCFSEDGPGLQNAQLADIYGVIMGASHHEPMCRAGVEWQNIYKSYGNDNTWNFAKNKHAITQFWKDGLLRNREFENIITVGMRGESDSKLLNENSTIKDNIEALKEVICVQNQLLQEVVNSDLTKVPRMLAIYKEVEDYYYGNDECEGLQNWSELRDVIFLLSDDNFGNLRSLPDLTEEMHPGGYGMYYHFDYHGAPISYEWQNTITLPKVWEQMTMAYEHGVRKLWIVNVGDIKGVEFPLNYFMDLAYDYDTWGISNIDSATDYTTQWIENQFKERVDKQMKGQLFEVINECSYWSAVRRPEAMNPTIYHPSHYREGERVWNEVKALMVQLENLKENMPDSCYNAYCSMIYYPYVATMNLILMNIEAGWNHYFSKRGSNAANLYGDTIRNRIKLDQQYVKEYHELKDGKWNHMMNSAHTGFRTWDAHNWTYPIIMNTVPIHEAKIIAGFRGSDEYSLGAHWQETQPLYDDSFTRPDCKDIIFDLDSRGDVDFTYYILNLPVWLSATPTSGEVKANEEGRVSILFECNRDQLLKPEDALLTVDIQFSNGNSTSIKLCINAAPKKKEEEKTFIETQNYIAIDAQHYYSKKNIGNDGWQVIRGLGKVKSALKCFPVNRKWDDTEEVPSVTYQFEAAKGGTYELQVYVASRNPIRYRDSMKIQIAVNDGDKQELSLVSENYYTEWICKEWADGVLNNSHIASRNIEVKQGLNQLTIYARDPEVILEKYVLHSIGFDLQDSYFGPKESYHRI